MPPFVGERFENFIHLAHGGTGNGESENSPLPIANQDLMALEPGMVIESVKPVVQTAIAGATACLVGDDDDPDGFVADADMTEATPGAYVGAGAYLAAGANKYYPAAKTLKWAQTGDSTDGKLCLVVSGYKLSS